MSKVCLHISFAIILTLFVVNLNANPKPKADNGIDIIINRVGPMVGPRMLGKKPRKSANGAGHWGHNGFWIPPNPGPEPKEVEWPAVDYPGYRLAVLPAAKPAAKPKKPMKGGHFIPWCAYTKLCRGWG